MKIEDTENTVRIEPPNIRPFGVLPELPALEWKKIDVTRVEPEVKIMIRGPMGGVHEISIETDDEE